MTRILLVTIMLAGLFDAGTCGDASEPAQREPAEEASGEVRTDDESQDAPAKTAAQIQRDALADEIAEHADVSYSMPARSVPDWFFRPTTELRHFLPDGDLFAWEAQFDCSASNSPACNLNYEVKFREVTDAGQVFERASALSELGFQVVEAGPPSLKAVRPIERSRAVEVVYLNRPGDRDVWLSATLREPVNPEITRMLAQKRFEPLADFAVEFLRVPYSLTVERAPYEDEVAYSATYDLSEKLRDDVESYLESNGFELQTRGAVAAKTSIWKHPAGWTVSLEGDESSFARFIVYFSASGHIQTDDAK